MTDRDGGPDAHPGDGRATPPPVTRSGHEPPPRPRVEVEDGVLGFSRVTRSRFGSRLFTLFFLVVYAVIALNLMFSLLSG